MTQVIGKGPKGKDMTTEDGRAAFKAGASQLAYRLGHLSKPMQGIKGQVDLPEQQLFTATMQEGSNRMNGFVKTAIGNFLRMLQTDNVSLLDLFCLGFFIYSDGVSQAILNGWKPPEDFIHEQKMLFEGALLDMMEHAKRTKGFIEEEKKIITDAKTVH